VTLPLSIAALRLPDTTSDGLVLDTEVQACGLALPQDVTAGGWGFHPLVPYGPDPAENLFRIRLVCMLLDTCGSFFSKGQLKDRLDTFLSYFQVMWPGCNRVSHVAALVLT
jgi:hypothetical protein